MTAPLTIIIPVRNREQYVERTLDSIAASTCPFMELLIVDNGSVDRSVEICQQWARAHQDVPVRFLTETRPGAAVARNCGLRAARSEFVYFFDSDDIFSNDFVAALSEKIEAKNVQNTLTAEEVAKYTIKNVVWKLKSDTESLIDQTGDANFSKNEFDYPTGISNVVINSEPNAFNCFEPDLIKTEPTI